MCNFKKTFSLSQMSKRKLAFILPWREKVRESECILCTFSQQKRGEPMRLAPIIERLGLLHFLYQIDLGGKVVRIAIEPYTTCMRAQGVAFILALLLEEVGRHKDGVLIIL